MIYYIYIYKITVYTRREAPKDIFHGFGNPCPRPCNWPWKMRHTCWWGRQAMIYLVNRGHILRTCKPPKYNSSVIFGDFAGNLQGRGVLFWGSAFWVFP